MTNVQERYPASNVTLPVPLPQSDFRRAAPGAQRAGMLRSADGIRRTGPRYAELPQSGLFGGIGGGMPVMGGGIIQQLLNIIQQLLSMLGLGGLAGTGNAFGGTQGPQTYFQNASGASVGDPHLRFNGTDGNGASQQTHYDSMDGHSDLLDSGSFAGGYQISTSVTQPGANGVTYNRQATVSTNFGGTQVSLDKNGNATIVQNGETIPLGDGQSFDLGNGETAFRNANGSVIVSEDNGMNGTIATTLSENGSGVDVNVQAANVDLGGDLVNPPPHTIGTPVPIMQPLQQQIALA